MFFYLQSQVLEENRMSFTGDVLIWSPLEKVWDFLIAPDQNGICGLGVKKIEAIGPTQNNRDSVRAGLGERSRASVRIPSARRAE